MKKDNNKRPTIDFNDYLQGATDDINIHMANSDAYLRALCTIKLYEIGCLKEDDLYEKLNLIFDNRTSLLSQNAKNTQKRAKVSLHKQQIAMWLLEKAATFVVFLCSLLVARYLS